MLNNEELKSLLDKLDRAIESIPDNNLKSILRDTEEALRTPFLNYLIFTDGEAYLTIPLTSEENEDKLPGVFYTHEDRTDRISPSQGFPYILERALHFTHPIAGVSIDKKGRVSIGTPKRKGHIFNKYIKLITIFEANPSYFDLMVESLKDSTDQNVFN